MVSALAGSSQEASQCQPCRQGLARNSFGLHHGVRKRSARKQLAPEILDAGKFLNLFEALALEPGWSGVHPELYSLITAIRGCRFEAPAAELGERVEVLDSRNCTEEAYWDRDQKVHAFRTVLRILCAGQPYSFNDRCPKKLCLEDIQLLLGNLCDIRKFPVWGGRNFVAGVLSKMLSRRVFLSDINQWFTCPTSQDMVVQPDLLSELSQHNMTWPPNPHLLRLCSSYRPKPSSGKQPFIASSAAALPALQSVGSASSCMDSSWVVLTSDSGPSTGFTQDSSTGPHMSNILQQQLSKTTSGWDDDTCCTESLEPDFDFSLPRINDNDTEMSEGTWQVV